MRKKFREGFWRGFTYAFNGIAYTLKHERNMKIQPRPLVSHRT